MGISADISGLNEFGANLGKIAHQALPDVDAVLEKGALNIKEDLVAGAKSSPHFKGLAGSISYDSQYSIGTARYEIGPEKGRNGGALGNIYYFGTSRGGGSGDLDGPLAREEPNTYDQLVQLAGKWGDRL